VLCISALYFIVVNHIRSRAQLTRLFVVILLVGFVHAFSHLIQNATGLYGKSTGVMFNVGNHFAGYMVIIIPLTVAMSFVIKDVGKRIVLIFVSIVMAAAMAFSLIAGAMLAFLFSLMLVALLFAGSGNTRKQALILGGVVLCSLLIISWFGYQPVLKELLTVTNLEAGSPAGRLSLWKSSLAMFADNPITGTGLGTFDHIYPKYRLPDIVGRAIYTHSDWLQLLTELGAIGFIIVLLGSALFFLSVLKRSVLVKLKDDWTKGIVVGGISSVGAGLVHALVEFNFHIPAIAVLFAIIIALTIVVSLSARYSAQESGIQHLPQWRIRVPAFARIGGFVCLLLVIGFSSVAMIRPCIADAYYQDGVKLEESLLWDEAAGKYQSALDLSRNNGAYFYALGNVYARRAKLTQGTEMHNKWHKSASDAYHQAMELCPTKGEYRLVLGRLQEVAGNAKDAESAYIKAISLDPNNAFYHRTYGSFCLRQDSIQKAVAEYKKSLEIYQSYLYSILEECDFINSGTQGSEKQSLPGIARQFCPQNAESYVTLARFCEDKGWYDDAFSEYQKAIALAPERIDLQQRLSRLLMRQGKFEEVVSLWRQFLKFHPQNAQAHIQLAAVYIKQKRLNDAIQQYLAAANLEPNNSSYCITAGDLYMQQGEFRKAI
jgi:tetratricopeptide (TPR) repeat protein/O-antigen ligase